MWLRGGGYPGVSIRDLSYRVWKSLFNFWDFYDFKIELLLESKSLGSHDQKGFLYSGLPILNSVLPGILNSGLQMKIFGLKSKAAEIGNLYKILGIFMILRCFYLKNFYWSRNLWQHMSKKSSKFGVTNSQFRVTRDSQFRVTRGCK